MNNKEIYKGFFTKKKEFFKISGLVTVLHTVETKEIWKSWKGNKSTNGRMAIVNFAIEKGFFIDDGNLLIENTKNAFDYLLDYYPGAAKSYIIKKAILEYYF